MSARRLSADEACCLRCKGADDVIASSRRLATLCAVTTGLTAAYGEVLSEPIPERLLDTVARLGREVPDA